MRIYPLPRCPGKHWERYWCNVCRMASWAQGDGRTLGMRLLIDPRNVHRLCQECRDSLVKDERPGRKKRGHGKPCPGTPAQVW